MRGPIARWRDRVFGRPMRGAVALATTVALGALAPCALAATPAGQWSFDEGTGTTAADATGAHPATLHGGATWAGGIIGANALATNGTTAYADTGDPVIDTSKSFTVSTWVKLKAISGYQTVVSVDGTQVSGFFLGLRDDTKRFAFVKLAGDSGQSGVIAGANFDPTANRWYQLTGVV